MVEEERRRFRRNEKQWRRSRGVLSLLESWARERQNTRGLVLTEVAVGSARSVAEAMEPSPPK
jgi:hypothetical protein